MLRSYLEAINILAYTPHEEKLQQAGVLNNN